MDTAGNAGRANTDAKAAMPSHNTAPRHTTTPGWQPNFRYQTEQLYPGSWRVGRRCPNGHYSVLAEMDSHTLWPCYTVNNFTDNNNWAFNVTRDTSVNTQDC